MHVHSFPGVNICHITLMVILFIKLFLQINMIQVAHVILAVQWYTRSDHMYQPKRSLLWLELRMPSVKQLFHTTCTPALFQLLIC